MPTLSLPPLANWQDFERLCRDLWKRLWQVEHALLHGRQGQPQHGVDVYAPIAGGARWAGVQCKQTDGALPSKKSIEAEVEKARKFNPGLSDYVIATTAPNDTKAQEWAREITKAQRKRKSFPVTIYGWGDICLELSKHRDLVKHHFPWFSWPEPDLSTNCARQTAFDAALDKVRDFLAVSERQNPGLRAPQQLDLLQAQFEYALANAKAIPCQGSIETVLDLASELQSFGRDWFTGAHLAGFLTGIKDQVAQLLDLQRPDAEILLQP